MHEQVQPGIRAYRAVGSAAVSLGDAVQLPRERKIFTDTRAPAGIGRIGTAGLPLRKSAIPHRSHSANGRNGS